MFKKKIIENEFFTVFKLCIKKTLHFYCLNSKIMFLLKTKVSIMQDDQTSPCKQFLKNIVYS